MVPWLKNLIDYGIRLQIIQLYFTIFVPLCIVIYFELNFIKPDKKITWNFTIVLFTTCTSLSRLYLLFFLNPKQCRNKSLPSYVLVYRLYTFLTPMVYFARIYSSFYVSLFLSLDLILPLFNFSVLLQTDKVLLWEY